MKLDDHGQLAIAIDQLHLAPAAATPTGKYPPHVSVRLAIGTHRAETFLPAMSAPAVAQLRAERARSLSRSRSNSRSSSLSGVPPIPARSKSRTRSKSRLRIAIPMTGDPESVEVEGDAATSIPAMPTGMSVPMFAAWRAKGAASAAAAAPPTRSTTAEVDLQELSMAEVADALSEMVDDEYDEYDDDDDEYDDDDEQVSNGDDDQIAATTDDFVVPAVPDNGALYAAAGLRDLVTLPLSLNAFLYHSLKVYVVTKSGKRVAKCSLRIKDTAVSGDPDHPVDLSVTPIKHAHLMDPRTDRVIGSVYVRLGAAWDAAPQPPSAPGSPALMLSSPSLTSPRDLASGDDHSLPPSPRLARFASLPMLARSLARSSVALSTYSMDSTMPAVGTPISEREPVTSADAAPAFDKVLPVDPTSVPSIINGTSPSVHSADSQQSRNNNHFTKVHALRELVRLGKAFFGEGWSGMPMRDILGALILLRKWANSPARFLGRPRAPVHALVPDPRIARHLQRNFRYSLVAYGRLATSFFGYGRGYVVEAVGNSDRGIAKQLLDIDDEDIVFWDMSRTGNTAAPHSYAAWIARENTIVLCVRGTYSIEDTLTDLLPHMEPFLSGATHGGIKQAAEYVYTRALPDLKAALARHRPHRLLVTGHSLGGAVAQLVGMMLRAHDAPDLRFLACGTSTDPEAFRIECLTYAAPPVATAELAANFPDFVNVVNDTDIVPRLSYATALDFKQMLVAASKQLTESTKSSSPFHKIGARLGLFKNDSLSAQFAALDQARMALGGATVLADHNAVVRAAAIGATRAELLKQNGGKLGRAGRSLGRAVTDAGWNAARFDSGVPEAHVKLCHAGTVYYLMRSDAATTRVSPDPVHGGRAHTRSRPKPHVELWQAGNEYSGPHGAIAKHVMLELAVADGMLLNHVPDSYDRALARAVVWADKCAALGNDGLLDGDDLVADADLAAAIAAGVSGSAEDLDADVAARPISAPGPAPTESFAVSGAPELPPAPTRSDSQRDPPSPEAVLAVHEVGNARADGIEAREATLLAEAAEVAAAF
ncbi:hypothetical protein BC828DRAFT_376931 [Blastocladiella britannica]|nr:hypothetical protein BC828DRAFT_376931 [Blastocladiella britannica]